MKKVFLGILGAILVIGMFAATGFAGYRMGFNQGAQTSSDGVAPRFDRNRMPGVGNPFERNFNRGFYPHGFGMMPHSRGFGFFSPLFFLGRIALIGLIIWFVYWLITRSGWRLSLKNTNPSAVKNEEEIKEAGG